MVLNSQSGRNDPVRRSMISRRRRPSMRTWLVLAVVALGAGVVWFVWGRGSEEGAPAVAGGPTPTVASSGTATAAQPVKVVKPAEKPVTVAAAGGTATTDGAKAVAPAPAPAAAAATGGAAVVAGDKVDSDTPALDVILEKVKGNNDKVECRRLLSRALFEQAKDLSVADQNVIREALLTINKQLVYSTRVEAGDPLASWYVIKPGDRLSRLVRTYKVTDDFIAVINGLKSKERINADQKLKMIQGPFHAVVEKAAYRMDIFLVEPKGQWVYVNSFAVGLGADDSTPTGKFVVRPAGKIFNPEWADPRTGKVWAKDDPQNPVGDYWIGLEGIDKDTADLRGYGIHGTIDPQSIGSQQSMGCVRLRDKDIEMVYKLLVEGESTVVIR